MKAIILAAGMGTRLRPLTSNTPKALVKVLGKPMVERQLEFLHEKGINDITIVTGYLHEKFDYLKEKYGVKLIHNDKYEVYNNLYTMYLVRDLLPESYILEGDVFLNRNVIEPNPKSSLYFCTLRDKFNGEWIVHTDNDGKVNEIEVNDGKNKYILSGISYWNREDGEYIVSKLEEAIQSSDFTDLFWDHMVKDNISGVNVYLKRLAPTDSYEIDSVSDLEKVESILSGMAEKV